MHFFNIFSPCTPRSRAKIILKKNDILISVSLSSHSRGFGKQSLAVANFGKTQAKLSHKMLMAIYNEFDKKKKKRCCACPKKCTVTLNHVYIQLKCI